MKKTFLKKILLGLFICGTIISSASCSSKAPAAIEGKEGVFAVLDTEKGQIVLDLYYDKTPMTVANFVGLAEGTLDAADGKKFYDGLKFHRVIADFMIQGGDPRGNGTGGPGYSFPDEFIAGLEFDKPGKLAMANSGPNTNGSQFFITHVPTDWLNYKHTIFGEVVTGQEVVDAVEQDDTIKSIKIYRQGDKAKKFKVNQEIFDNLIKDNEAKQAKLKEELLAKVTEGCEKTPEGIYYKIMQEGSGEKCGERQFVKVEYVGYLVDGTLFDATKGLFPQGGHDPVSFVTHAGQMITGFDLMVQDMKLGELRKIILPPEMAYGPDGYGPIPPAAYTCFDVQLIEIQ